MGRRVKMRIEIEAWPERFGRYETIAPSGGPRLTSYSIVRAAGSGKFRIAIVIGRITAGNQEPKLSDILL